MKSSYHSITFGNSVNHNYAGRYLWRKIYYLLSLNLSGIHVYNCELLEFEKCSVLKKTGLMFLRWGASIDLSQRLKLVSYETETGTIFG